VFRTCALMLSLIVTLGLAAEEVPLDSCDRLPTIQISAGKKQFRFLLDTAASSFLNAKSFLEGAATGVKVYAWNGASATVAREVVLRDFVVGKHRIIELRLPAIDLSAIGHACGQRIDGILGADLMEKLNLTIDLTNRVARLGMESQQAQDLFPELEKQLASCLQAFNQGDEKTFAGCLDPEVVLFTVNGDYRGCKSVLGYFRENFFAKQPRVSIAMTTRSHHALGDAIWLEYELQIQSSQPVTARGTAIYRKEGDQWLLVNMNHSTPPTPGPDQTKLPG